jgi:hypothetical protein
MMTVGWERQAVAGMVVVVVGAATQASGGGVVLGMVLVPLIRCPALCSGILPAADRTTGLRVVSLTRKPPADTAAARHARRQQQQQAKRPGGSAVIVVVVVGTWFPGMISYECWN